ncbi:hypothetical protein [Marinospirillum sp.]|uniref:hypothetical protein n=1 Tax=Marinospirillum sp. TaxID=2183934 RepID=UPI0028702B26|nr:hypothetical protein [Marinospirillum sp.]MDR9469272.1 hypothetical protein [Marinospirillum sp.]
MQEQEFGKKWGIALGFLLFSLVLSLVFYLLFWVAYGSPWPDEWAKRDSYCLVLFVGNILLLSFLNYVVVRKRVDIEAALRKVFNIDEFKEHKPMDVILSHYGNMASVGLLMALLIFTIKPFIESQSVLFIGPVLVVVFFALVGVCSVILMKPLIYLSRYRARVAIISMLVILMIDMQGLRFFISSVPK